jgi:drug/metabolite transporter (DMT)-like permease
MLKYFKLFAQLRLNLSVFLEPSIMHKNNFLLFAIPALIWGSTWIVITFQLGTVDPLISVIYRFGLAGLLMLIYARLKKLNLKFSAREHFFMAVQGFFLFGMNYWLVYQAEQYIPSGLLAVAFSTIIFMNIGFGALLLKRPVNIKVAWAAIAGLSGTMLIFRTELISLNMTADTINGTILAFGSVVLASIGNITSAYNQQSRIPVVQANAYGMLYGSLFMTILAFSLGREFSFDYSATYIASLIYLTLFGSVVAFAGYLTLIGRIGADKAAYTLVVIPIIAILISIVFEDYQLTTGVVTGIVLIVIGNVMALRK